MKNYILIALLILITAVAVMLGMTLPRYREYAGLRHQLSQQREAIRAGEERLGELTAIDHRLNQNQANLAKIASSLPFHPDAPSVIIFLSEKAAENGLVIKDAPSASTIYYPWGGTTPGVQSIKIGLSAVGPYSSLRGFIQAVESSARLIRVTNISSAEEQEQGRGRYSLIHRLDFETFFYQN